MQSTAATTKALRLRRSAVRKARVALATVLVAAGLVAPALAAPPAHASSNTFTVTRIDDRADANPGDGVCSISISGTFCTLRAAVT